MNRISRIVSDGRGRFHCSGECAALRARLVAECRQRHGAQLKGAAFWRRAWLRVVIEREVRAELGRLCPSGALYIAGGAR